MNRSTAFAPVLTAAAVIAVTAVVAALLAPPPAAAFCGFYVARADTGLFNKASQVVLVRDGDRTVLSMASDFRGDPQEFAVVVPVPTFIEREQIHVANKALIDHLDAYTSPRLVEYFDEDPCRVYPRMEMMKMNAPSAGAVSDTAARARALGVTIEATYTVGEYDILILSATQSDGLITWLTESGYKIPKGAEAVVGSYLKQGMRFFVAKVNLAERAKLGYSFLRPLQVAYETPKFMLPIRLGTVNADGPQELFIFALTRTGRVETTNYRTVRLPTDAEIPVFVKDDFGNFYRDLFSRQVERESMKAVFLEYAWDMGWCDPCAADPLSQDELRELGVFWLGVPPPQSGVIRAPGPGRPTIEPGPQNVFVTRLHVRYDRDRFPEDLVFQETGDRANFQGRYILRHPWTGSSTCQAAQQYRLDLRERRQREVDTLASLTGWSVDDIRRRMNLPAEALPADPGEKTSWWQRLWGG